MKLITHDIYHDDINVATQDNENYRKVVYTVPGSMQLVLMSLKPGEDIPFEMHSHTSQFIRVETGSGIVQIENKGIIREYVLEDDTAIIIPYGTKHRIANTSNTQNLKIYTIYTPPEHPSDRLQTSRLV